MNETEAAEVPWVRCSCCGQDMPDDAEHNTDFGVIPNPHDNGYGMCLDCGGDKRETALTEAAIKRRLGWAGRMFYEARFEVLEKKLRPDLAEKFRAMTYGKKIVVVAGLVEKGLDGWLSKGGFLPAAWKR
jgi:hypothetical protein